MLQKIMHKILHEIMPKTIAARAYLVTSVVVTVLMIVIGTMYADATRERIFLAEERKLIDIVTVLDNRLDSDGLIDNYGQAASSTDEAARQGMRASLQSIVEEVGRQYPGFAMGYSLRDSRLAAYPYVPSGPRPQDLNLESAYRDKRLHASTTLQSNFRNDQSMRMIYPIYNDGKVLGHVWSSLSMANVNGAVYQSWFNIFGILAAAWLVLMVILKRIFDSFSKTVAELADKIARQDDTIDLQKVPQFQPVLTAVTALRDSLQEKETAYRTLVENSPNIVIRCDTKGQVIYVNPALTKDIQFIHSYSAGNQVLSRDEFIRYTAEMSRNAAATGIRVEFEYKRNLSSGKTRHFKATMVPEKDESGQVISVLTISRDITDIKDACELFLSAFNLSPNIMAVTRQTDHAIIEVNNTFLQLFGLPYDSVIGHTPEELGLSVERDSYQ